MYNSALKVSELSELTSSLKGNDKLILTYTTRTSIPETSQEVFYYYLYNKETHEYSYTKFVKDVETGNYKEINTTYNYSVPFSSLNGGHIYSYNETISNEDGGVNDIRLRFDNNKVYSIKVFNGSKGETGRKGFTGDKGDKGPSANLVTPNEGTLIKITNDGTLGDASYIVSAYLGYTLNQKVEGIKEEFLQEEFYQALQNKKEDTKYYTFEEAGNISTNKFYKISEDESLINNG